MKNTDIKNDFIEDYIEEELRHKIYIYKAPYIKNAKTIYEPLSVVNVAINAYRPSKNETNADKFESDDYGNPFIWGLTDSINEFTKQDGGIENLDGQLPYFVQSGTMQIPFKLPEEDFFYFTIGQPFIQGATKNTQIFFKSSNLTNPYDMIENNQYIYSYQSVKKVEQESQDNQNYTRFTFELNAVNRDNQGRLTNFNRNYLELDFIRSGLLNRVSAYGEVIDSGSIKKENISFKIESESAIPLRMTPIENSINLNFYNPWFDHSNFITGDLLRKVDGKNISEISTLESPITKAQADLIHDLLCVNIMISNGWKDVKTITDENKASYGLMHALAFVGKSKTRIKMLEGQNAINVGSLLIEQYKLKYADELLKYESQWRNTKALINALSEYIASPFSTQGGGNDFNKATCLWTLHPSNLQISESSDKNPVEYYYNLLDTKLTAKSKYIKFDSKKIVGGNKEDKDNPFIFISNAQDFNISDINTIDLLNKTTTNYPNSVYQPLNINTNPYEHNFDNISYMYYMRKWNDYLFDRLYLSYIGQEASKKEPVDKNWIAYNYWSYNDNDGTRQNGARISKSLFIDKINEQLKNDFLGMEIINKNFDFKDKTESVNSNPSGFDIIKFKDNDINGRYNPSNKWPDNGTNFLINANGWKEKFFELTRLNSTSNKKYHLNPKAAVHHLIEMHYFGSSSEFNKLVLEPLRAYFRTLPCIDVIYGGEDQTKNVRNIMFKDDGSTFEKWINIYNLMKDDFPNIKVSNLPNENEDMVAIGFYGEDMYSSSLNVNIWNKKIYFLNDTAYNVVPTNTQNYDLALFKKEDCKLSEEITGTYETKFDKLIITINQIKSEFDNNRVPIYTRSRWLDLVNEMSLDDNKNPLLIREYGSRVIKNINYIIINILWAGETISINGQKFTLLNKDNDNIASQKIIFT